MSTKEVPAVAETDHSLNHPESNVHLQSQNETVAIAKQSFSLSSHVPDMKHEIS